MKNLGLHIIAVNNEKNDWAEPFITEWILTDMRDEQRVIDDIRNFLSLSKHPPEGAITFFEDDVPLLARICKEFGFTGNSPSTAVLTRDKYVMQERLRECGLHAIKQQLVRNEEDLTKAMEDIGYPSVMKPMKGCGSEFVIYVTSAEEAKKTYAYLKKNSLKEYGDFLYQEFIEGTEFSVECFCQNGAPNVAGIQEKTAMNLPYFIETGDIAPPRITPEQKQMLEEETRNSLIALGVRDSIAHVEIKWTKKGVQVIEIGSRIGGDDISTSTKTVYGFDLVTAGCEIALGLPVSEKVVKTDTCAVTKYFIPKRSGTIARMTGFEALSIHPNIVEVYLWKTVGDSVAVPPEGYEVPGWVTVKGESFSHCKHVMEEIMSSIKIEVRP